MKKKLLAAVFGAVLVLGACGGGDKGNEADKDATDGDVVAVDAEAVVQKVVSHVTVGTLKVQALQH